MCSHLITSYLRGEEHEWREFQFKDPLHNCIRQPKGIMEAKVRQSTVHFTTRCTLNTQKTKIKRTQKDRGTLNSEI